MNLTIFLVSYAIIIISIIGFALSFKNIINTNLKLEFEFCLLGVVLFLMVISFSTHFFLKHGYIHNSVILILGIILFFIFSFKEKRILKNYSKYIFLIFGILIFGLLIFKTHDDFSYYHFPYTFYLTQENLIIGTGNLNHGFRTPSSIFYLNSLFYLPSIKYFSFQFGAVLIFGISNLILILKLKNDYKNKEFDFIFFFTLLSFLFINIFFYRISEHGTDRSAQILIFILLIEALSLFRNQSDLKNLFSKIFIILGLIISLKAFYILYIFLLFPIFFLINKKKLIKLFLSFLSNFYFYLFFLIGFSLMLVNVFNSGCILYPVSFTCIANLEWSLSNEANLMNNWYEQWSKAGAGPNFRVENPEEYIKGFNWLSNWIELYFFNKVLDFLFGITFLLLIIFIIFFSKKKNYLKINKKIFWIYFIIIILFFEWFYNHPSLRYGGYSLIASILFIPFSIYISKISKKNNLKKKIISLVVLSLIIFVGRNINRIGNEIEKYDYNFIANPYYEISENHLRIDSFLSKLNNKYKNCEITNLKDCKINDGIYIDKINNYYYLKKSND